MGEPRYAVSNKMLNNKYPQGTILAVGFGSCTGFYAITLLAQVGQLWL